MKKIYSLFLMILVLVSFDVYAESHDVEAKYDVTYNVNIFKGHINNNTIQINVNNFILEFTSTQTNIDVVVIKAEGESNDYAKTFTGSSDNYYLAFYKNGQKITSNDINVKVIGTDKVLKVYDHLGNLINQTSGDIKLDNNDYFISMSTKEYIFADPMSYIQNLEDTNLNSGSLVEIYNHNNVLVSNSKVLGTGYRIRVNNSGVVNEYVIVVKGDVNSDGKISVLDIVKVNNDIVDETKKLEGIYSIAADYNGDGKLSVLDIVKINNAIVGGN